MDNYLNNNLKLINQYQKLYENEIDIDAIIDMFISKKLLLNSNVDYARFRVFVDSCLLLYNRKKVNRFLKKKFSFVEFLNEMNKNQEVKVYIDFVKEKNLIPSDSGCQLFYSYENEVSKPWDQVAIIRNALAHMQYGYFMQPVHGPLVCYGIFNKDKGIRKEIGVIVEPILHSFISKFFSNYHFGIPYKHTFFSNYSIVKKRKVNEMLFYTVTSRGNYDDIYTGFNDNLMKKIANAFQSEDIFTYLKKYENNLVIKEEEVSDVIKIENFNAMALKRKINTATNYYAYGLKAVLDPETEISNFLVHIGQLNQALYDYSILRHNDSLEIKEIKKYKEQIVMKMEELKEDKNAKIAFDIGFVYLKAMNFALRVEDDDFEPLNFSEIDVSRFIFDNKLVHEYCERNNIDINGEQRYIIDRMRNSLMHGTILFELDELGNIYFVFVDQYNNREEKIKIVLEKLELFLAQSSLYKDMPVETPIYKCK